MTFGEKLQKLRKERGLTQEQLAGQIHVSRQALSRWELGAAVPDTENVLQLSQFFGVSADYLLRDQREGDPPDVRTAGTPGRRTALIAGWALTGLSALGLVILGILGTAVYPASYTVLGPTDRTYEGLAGFLLCHRLVWLFLLLCAALAAGIGILLWLWLRARRAAGTRARKKFHIYI